MIIRTIQERDYNDLIRLYRSFFSVHNIFQQPDEEIIKYLQEQAQKNEFVVYEENSQVKGALILVQKGENVDGTHKIWKYRHFAFESEDIASQLLEEAEKIISGKSKTAKVELAIAENERGKEFYQAAGYEQEGMLKNHFRWGETCYILAKSFS